MCSVDTCTNIEVEKKLNLSGAPCRKCEEKAQIVLQDKFPYCRECFLYYFQHKYRSGLGKNKIIKTGDNILVAFSGSFYSVCLLHLIHSSLVEERKKKTKFNVIILFIDESCGRKSTSNSDIIKCVTDLTSGYGYKLYYAGLACAGDKVVLSSDPSVILNVNFEENNIFNACTNETARLDLFERSRLYVMREAAKELKCGLVFTAETSDHIAVKLFGNLAIGRGRELHSDTAYSYKLRNSGEVGDGEIEFHNRRKYLLLVRPLREFSKKEVVYYNIFHNLHLYNFPRVIEDDNFSSVQKLSENFLAELQNNFPSSIPTVTSTACKLTSFYEHQPVECVEEDCVICEASLENNDTTLTARDAMRISQFTSIVGERGFDPHNFSPIYANGEEKNHIVEEVPLCYACSNIVTKKT